MEIITKLSTIEMIKPSSPTPKSLQKHQLSILDQSMPPIYSPVVYFFEPNPKTPNSQKSNHLKKSLSEFLSKYYPLAGRHVGDLYVDCSDGGVPFFEAEADCDLTHAIPLANPNILNKFLPWKTVKLQDFCMAVQATYFRCGGLALAILISHRIADGGSFISLVNAWSAAARNVDGGGGVPLPKFGAAAYFSPLQDPSVLAPAVGMGNEELTTRIFRFPAATVSLLRERYSGGGGGRRPSRMEALSAFIWTRFVSALGYDPNKIYVINHMIDIRSRVDPVLSEYHFGNIVGISRAMPAAGDGGDEVVQKIRGALKSVKSNYVAKDEEQLKEKVVRLCFSSLLGSSLYEADFGWGKPVWIGQAQLPLNNIVLLYETKSGGGVEAYINLTKQDMERFEPYLELQILRSNL